MRIYYDSNRVFQTLHTECHSNWCHGQRILEGRISMMNLLDEKSLDKIAESTEIRLWKSFIIFGSGVLAVCIIVWLIKLASIIIDTIIYGYALHLSIVAAFIFYPLYWNSVIHLLLHLGKAIKARIKTRTNNNLKPFQRQKSHIKPKFLSSSENHHSAHNISIMDEVKSYTELRKTLRS